MGNPTTPAFLMTYPDYHISLGITLLVMRYPARGIVVF